MDRHALGMVVFYLAFLVGSFLFAANAIAEYQAAPLSRRYSIFSMALSLTVSGFTVIVALTDGSVLWGIPATLAIFSVCLYGTLKIHAEQHEQHEKIFGYWKAHVDAGEDVGDTWLYDGKVYNFGAEEREATRKKLRREWPMYLRLLRKALEPLAAPPDKQRAYIANLGSPSDLHELAVELDEIVELVPRMVEASLLTEHEETRIRAVHRKLDKMDGESDDSVWCVDALERSGDWDDVRSLARTALSKLPTEGEPAAKKADVHRG